METLRLATACLAVVLTACAVPVGTGLGTAAPAAATLSRGAWLAPVEIQELVTQLRLVAP